MRMHQWTCAAVGVVLAASVVSGCGGSDSDKDANGSGTTELKVGVLPIVDDSPLFLAKKNGYFKAKGIKVTPVILKSGAEALTRIQSGNVDLAWSSYASTVSAVAKTHMKIRVVVDGYAAVEHLFTVLAMPKSGIKKPKDLVGKKVAINSLKGLGPLLLNSALKTAGIDPKDIKMVPTPFPKMPANLQNHAVDAAWTTEPFVTQASQKLGAVEVMDTATGPTAGLPIAGFMTSEKTASEKPKAMAAFQSAMFKAQKLAADRSKVEAIMPTYIENIKPKVASTITIGTYPTSLSAKRLQRVPDLMQQLGILSQHFDIKSILWKPQK